MPAGFVTAAFMAGAGRGTAAAHAMKCARLMCWNRSEEHTSELQSLMSISYAGFCLKKKNKQKHLHYMKYCYRLSTNNAYNSIHLINNKYTTDKYINYTQQTNIYENPVLSPDYYTLRFNET